MHGLSAGLRLGAVVVTVAAVVVYRFLPARAQDQVIAAPADDADFAFAGAAGG